MGLLFSFSSCKVIHEIDQGMSSFNDHAAGWAALISIVGFLSGWSYALIELLKKRFGFRDPNKKEVEKKRPFMGLTINGKSLFRELDWADAEKGAKTVVTDLTSWEKNYEPTLIVCIGRGGAIFGSMISYLLNDLPILGIERFYGYQDGVRVISKPYYPFRVPKAYLERVLLVAGEAHTRRTLKACAEYLRGLGAVEIRNCVFYNQQLPPSEDVAQDVVIDYSGKEGKKDYLLPWQSESSLRPSLSNVDADSQNDRAKRSVPDSKNYLEPDEWGFYCMRHAETTQNSSDCFIGSGSPDVELSQTGLSQCEEVAEYFRRIGVSFDTIFCSEMKRSRQTAMEISMKCGGMVVAKKELNEFDYGDWEGMARQDIIQKYPNEYHSYCSCNDGSFCPPGGTETFNEVKERVGCFLGELMVSKIASRNKVLVVTHKTVGRILYQTMSNGTIGNFRDIPMKNASVGYVSVVEGKTRIVLDNKTCD